MILSDRDIKKYLEEGKIEIRGLKDPNLQIGPSSVDLRLGGEIRKFKRIEKAYIDPREDSSTATELAKIDENKHFILHPGEFVLGTTEEYVKLPADIVGRLEGRSSLGRLGIVVHSTAGYVDPGFHGKLTLEMSNIGMVPVALYPGMRICQLVFVKMSSECEVPYNKRNGSKYVGQDAPKESKIHEDHDF